MWLARQAVTGFLVRKTFYETEVYENTRPRMIQNRLFRYEQHAVDKKIE